MGLGQTAEVVFVYPHYGALWSFKPLTIQGPWAGLTNGIFLQECYGVNTVLRGSSSERFAKLLFIKLGCCSCICKLGIVCLVLLHFLALHPVE